MLKSLLLRLCGIKQWQFFFIYLGLCYYKYRVDPLLATQQSSDYNLTHAPSSISILCFTLTLLHPFKNIYS